MLTKLVDVVEGGSPSLPDLKRLVIIRGENPFPSTFTTYEDLLREATLPHTFKIVNDLNTSLDPHSLCNFQFTSGTTGAPKATTLTGEHSMYSMFAHLLIWDYSKYQCSSSLRAGLYSVMYTPLHSVLYSLLFSLLHYFLRSVFHFFLRPLSLSFALSLALCLVLCPVLYLVLSHALPLSLCLPLYLVLYLILCLALPPALQHFYRITSTALNRSVQHPRILHLFH